MKYLIVVIWLLLGLLYFWIWNNSMATCCAGDGLSSTEMTTPAVSKEQLDAEAKVEALRKAEKEAEVEAEKAIAAAADTKTVTSVKSTDVSGKKKLTFYFPYNSAVANYSQATESDIEEIVANIKSSGRKVTISGHTDNSGPSDTNKSLGQQRADDIRKKLISKGLPSAQVVARSYGEEQPVATNETSAGRQKNRRVELIIE